MLASRGTSSGRRWEEDEEVEEEPRRRPNWPIIGAVAAILIFVGALMFILFSSLFSDTLGPNQNSIRVPRWWA